MRRRAIAIVAAALLLLMGGATQSAAGSSGVPTQFNEFTVAQLQSLLASGKLSSVALTKFYLKRIDELDREGPGVNSVIQLNPDALELAEAADAARAHGKKLGPLQGIPVLLKDNIDTGDRMQTTAGSLALVGRPSTTDSTVARNLRAG